MQAITAGIAGVAGSTDGARQTAAAMRAEAARVAARSFRLAEGLGQVVARLRAA
jgi:hypothetical protein